MRNYRMSSSMLAAMAIALAGAGGVSDGPRGGFAQVDRRTRRKPAIQVHVQQRDDIAAWNAAVDAKKRAKKAAKLAKRAQS